ncbi:MAG: hypothetical protein KAR06_09785 [Deltaproteobacteria bacterium]|nr:hypothetical protein [Deltaproteobacteria bacterium]
MEQQLRDRAKEHLTSGEVSVVIGYGWNRRKTQTAPVFITKPEDVEKLVFNKLCVNNLSVYLTRKYPDIKALGRPAIVAKGCDIKNLVVMMSEGQIKREELHIMGMVCDGVIFKQDLWPRAAEGTADTAAELKPEVTPVKCLNCEVRNPHVTDDVIGTPTDFTPPEEPTGIVFDMIDKIDKMESKEKWNFW